MAAWFALMLTMASATLAAKPEVVLRGGLISPRTDITATESLVWRGQLTLRHRISPRLVWRFSGDATPRTLTRPDGFRLYTGQIQAEITSYWKATVGRQFLWNNLQTARFDGIALSRASGGFRHKRTLTFYTGLTPDTELRTDYGKAGKPMAGAMFQVTNGSTRYGLQAWTTHMADTLNFYLGGSLRRSFGSRVTQVVDLALDLTHQAPEKVRLRSQVRLTPESGAFIQYRYAGQLTMSPYPWIADTTFSPRQSLSAGGHLVLKGLRLELSLSQRLGDRNDRYITARLARGGLMLSWQANAQSIYEGQNVQLSGQRRLFGHLRAGGSVGAGSYTLFDEHSAAVSAMESANPLDIAQERAKQSSLAATFWVQGSRAGHFSYRLFTQFTRNRFFRQDGRVGLQVTYAL